MSARIKVLIVDDSAVVRQVLSARLARDPAIEVMGGVADPIFAMERMNRDWPDVVVLDVEMPRMDGITFLKRIMAVRPTPVVICSTLTQKGAETTMQALSAGAVGVVEKPKQDLRKFLENDEGDLVHAVKAAAQANMRHVKSAVVRSDQRAAHRVPVTAGGDAAPSALATTTDRLVAIGTSTGGTQALETVLTALPPVVPGIVIVQHMPERFTAAFAARLDGLCDLEILEAKHGDRVIPGRALIAPGGRHMAIRRNGAQYVVEILDAPPVNRHRPSVDVLFRSVAKWAGRNAFGIILTGMGDDGARGLLEMRQAGAKTLAQDEKTCVVYGMPKEAMALGAAEAEAPLSAVAGLIERYGRQG